MMWSEYHIISPIIHDTYQSHFYTGGSLTFLFSALACSVQPQPRDQAESVRSQHPWTTKGRQGEGDKTRYSIMYPASRSQGRERKTKQQHVRQCFCCFRWSRCGVASVMSGLMVRLGFQKAQPAEVVHWHSRRR